MIDFYKQMCIGQGYVPSTCTMDGQMCWLLVKNGKNPCDGCNQDRETCKGGLKKEENKSPTCIKEEPIKTLPNICKPIHYVIEVNWEQRGREHIAEVITKDILNSTAYVHQCCDMRELVPCILYICSIFNIGQIHIETIPYGKRLCDELMEHSYALKAKDIDVILFNYTNMLMPKF